jgi:flagellar protein FliS
MLPNSNAHTHYKNNSVYTASPEELTLLLYNGLVKFIIQAQDALARNDIQAVHNSIVRAQDIISEFQVTLDMKYEVSEGLSAMYEYISHLLLQANLKKEGEYLQEALGYVRELRDTWAQAMKIAKQNLQTPQSTQPPLKDVSNMG